MEMYIKLFFRSSIIIHDEQILNLPHLFWIKM